MHKSWNKSFPSNNNKNIKCTALQCYNIKCFFFLAARHMACGILVPRTGVEPMPPALVLGTSLMAQWLRLCLSMQGTQVQSLVREDPTCHGAAKPMHHSYWNLRNPGPMCHNYRLCVLQLWKPVHQEPMLCNKRSQLNEEPVHHNEE